MALSRLAQQFADEIRNHDWSDAPYRADKAGHKREHDTHGGVNNFPQLKSEETDNVRLNAMWVAAQVLGYNDPNFNEFEFAEACGVNTRTPSGRPNSGHITAGLRVRQFGEGRVLHGHERKFQRPGTYEFDQ